MAAKRNESTGTLCFYVLGRGKRSFPVPTCCSGGSRRCRPSARFPSVILFLFFAARSRLGRPLDHGLGRTSLRPIPIVLFGMVVSMCQILQVTLEIPFI